MGLVLYCNLFSVMDVGDVSLDGRSPDAGFYGQERASRRRVWRTLPRRPSVAFAQLSRT